MWLLGTGVEGLVVLHAWHHSPIGAMAWKLVISAIRRPAQQRRSKDCNKAESGVTLRS